MSTPTLTRRARLTGAVGDGFTAPKDIAEILGDDVRVEVGPGRVVTLRPGRLTQADLNALAEPITRRDQLIRSTTPLTEAQREALTEFLAS
jgi:hypothetical protein